ncbi:hypothetical protein Anas_01269 [Armadillidium nasatum]|uniref:Hemimethylated DNA-binding domain-containing protein n=1 Tax=Armadillidium nasatum TaxID=96803 RepID=A0A5N5TKW7_9CRUS|nr:hypothetical protein Anas_01269 [Armadillidium nasatum]
MILMCIAFLLMKMGRFEQLSDEILIKIFDDDCLSAEDLISVKNVCCRFDYICNYEKLWKTRFQSRYPWAWKKIYSRSIKPLNSQKGKKDLETAVTVSLKFEKIFNSISHQSYKFNNITSPILSSIFELLNVGSIGHLIVFNELHGIVHDGSHKRLQSQDGFSIPENEAIVLFQAFTALRHFEAWFTAPNSAMETDLTKLYYAKCLIYHVKHYLSSKKLKELFKLPPQRQSLEKAAYYFAEVFQSNDLLDTEYEEISSELDKLVLIVQSYLRSTNSNHPAISIRLFSPDEPLESSPYSHEECIEIFQCINLKFFARSFFRANVIKEIHRVLLNKVIETKEGNDITLSIIYSAICHRLGILILPTIRNDRYKLKWKSPNSETIVFINPLEGRFEYLYNNRRGVCIDDCPTKTVLCHLAADSFQIARENAKNFSTDIDMVAAAGMVLFLESVSEDYNKNILDDVLGYCVKYEVHLESIIEICQKIFRNCTRVEETIKSLSTYAEDKLTLQTHGPRSLETKRRKFVDVKYATGMIMHHKFAPEHGVIFGWDKKHDLVSQSTFQESAFLSDEFNKCYEGEPFYKLLLSDGSCCYLAESLLEIKRRPTPVEHPEVGRYFRLFNGIFYVPNAELLMEYPEDEKVKHKFLNFFVED